MPFFLTSTLSVSRKAELDCKEMAKYLGNYGIMTSITPNISTQPELENGCRLVHSITSKDDMKIIWEKLRDKYNFDCAHINIPNKFDGCILDFLAESKCSR